MKKRKVYKGGFIVRFPKDFRRDGNHYYLMNTKVCILQWNSGKNKNFIVEKYDNRTNPITIPGKGDEAMIKAIEIAYKIANM